MQQEIKFTIPIQPVTKKNSCRIINIRGKPRLIPSKAYMDYEKNASLFCPAANIERPVNIKCIYYMQTRRAVDLTNLLEATDDLLVKRGTIVDDNSRIVVSHDGSRVLYDKDNPRTEVTITKLQDTEYGGNVNNNVIQYI